MTTILATLDRMASDTFISDGSRGAKIYRGPGYLLGEACEDTFYSLRLVNWVLDGQRGPVPEARPGEDHEGTLLLLRPGQLSVLDWRGVEMPIDNPYFGVGTGAPFGLGALAAGATLEQAMTIAAYYDGGTKPPFHFVDLPRRRRK